MMHADSCGADINYLKSQIHLFNELLRPTKQAMALRDSKILFGLLLYLSLCLVFTFLMTYYLHMAWSLGFLVLFIIGALVFHFWRRRSNRKHLHIHRAN